MECSFVSVTAEDEGQYGGAEPPRIEGYGHVQMNGTTKLVSWILGIFGAVMTIMLSLVLTAVYNLNGDLHEMKGEIRALTSEVNAMRVHGSP